MMFTSLSLHVIISLPLDLSANRCQKPLFLNSLLALDNAGSHLS